MKELRRYNATPTMSVTISKTDNGMYATHCVSLWQPAAKFWGRYFKTRPEAEWDMMVRIQRARRLSA